MKNIADTAYLVAMYRALESERADALFHDPYARLLAGGKGAMLVEVLGEKEKITNAIALRTRLIDEQIEKLVQSKKIDTVLNLAAGLDTRPYRLNLPVSLRWIEVDFGEILADKEQKLQHAKPVCTLERIKLDITDSSLRKRFFADITKNSRQALVITEGLLSYLPEPQVASIAADIYEQSKLNWWLFELESTDTMQNYDKIYARRIFDQYFASGNKTLLFAPTEGISFFQRYGWRVAESLCVWKELRRLKRQVKLAWLVERLMKLNQAYWDQQSSVVLLCKS
ncbi:putative methyltransferase [Calothrix sp. NIES-4071]|nr:putative methyltransferase [Calothrix sp. NIES-4071]BAZ59576.1 putative methyltransferase [Calothrix sp. NIES-4105]